MISAYIHVASSRNAHIPIHCQIVHSVLPYTHCKSRYPNFCEGGGRGRCNLLASCTLHWYTFSKQFYFAHDQVLKNKIIESKRDSVASVIAADKLQLRCCPALENCENGGEALEVGVCRQRSTAKKLCFTKAIKTRVC